MRLARTREGSGLSGEAIQLARAVRRPVVAIFSVAIAGSKLAPGEAATNVASGTPGPGLVPAVALRSTVRGPGSIGSASRRPGIVTSGAAAPTSVTLGTNAIGRGRR